MPDSQVRRPQYLANWLAAHSLLPLAQKTIIVTGSKGKGSTARMIAWHLQRAGYRVGLVVSPEELHHLDRIRIHNRPIKANDFIRLVQQIMPPLFLLEKTIHQEGHSFYYHSPSDLFLVLALAWFHEQAVDYWVLEGGRGAQFDLIGQIPAQIGVVTSVFLEHASFLGSDEQAIANDKFSLLNNCQSVVAPVSLARWLPAQKHQVAWLPVQQPSAPPNVREPLVDEPFWLGQARALSKKVIELLGEQASEHWDSPSFSRHGKWLLDAAVADNALDAQLLQSLSHRKVAVLLGLTRDKAVLAVSQALATAGLTAQYQLNLTSNDNNVSEPQLEVPTVSLLNLQTGFTPVQISTLQAFAAHYDLIYCVGVQLTLRSLRAALGVEQLVGPNFDQSMIKDDSSRLH